MSCRTLAVVGKSITLFHMGKLRHRSASWEKGFMEITDAMLCRSDLGHAGVWIHPRSEWLGWEEGRHLRDVCDSNVLETLSTE